MGACLLDGPTELWYRRLSPLFANLSPDEVGRVADLLRPRAFPAGVNLFLQDEEGEIAYIIERGTIKIVLTDEDGTDVILAILGPGELVGEMSVVDGLGRSASAIAMEPCSLHAIDRGAFGDCLRTVPMMAYNLVGLLSRRLRLANAQIQSLATLDVYGRVARQVLDFARAYGEPVDGGLRIPLRLTQQDLASLVGASRVRVNQVLVTYKRRGYLAVDYAYRITILDEVGLAEQCQ